MTDDVNARLVEAVAYYDVEGVKQALSDGADPNYSIQYIHLDEESKKYNQPDRPLKLVVFRLSDSFVDDAALKRFAEIARILLDHGADPVAARGIAESLYGPYDPGLTGRFADVLHLVAQAAIAKERAGRGAGAVPE